MGGIQNDTKQRSYTLIIVIFFKTWKWVENIVYLFLKQISNWTILCHEQLIGEGSFKTLAIKKY